jgi:DNA/RNA-binding domain of Phe-tRNA-synthetase-like protein
MSAEEGEDPNDPPRDGEVVFADARHVLCRRWNWRQDARSLVTTQTKRAALTVQSNGVGDVEAAAEAVAKGIARECAATCRIVVADRNKPVSDF